jgi:hypothetical protein
MSKRKVALFSLLVFCAPAFSQAPVSKDFLPERGDAYAGYWFVSSDAGFSGTTYGGSNHGWNAGVDIKAFKWVSVSGEFDMGFGRVTNATSQTFTGLVGPRVFLPIPGSPKLTPFAEGMCGGTRVSIGHSPDSRPSTSSFTALVGGGADYRILMRLSWRGQLGYLYSQHITLINDEVQNVANPPVWHLQFSTGPVLRF